MGKSGVVNGHSQDESMVELLLRAVSPDPSLYLSISLSFFIFWKLFDPISPAAGLPAAREMILILGYSSPTKRPKSLTPPSATDESMVAVTVIVVGVPAGPATTT